MHQRFNVIGSLAVPGRMGNFNHVFSYYSDLIHRPDDRDMKNVATFVDQTMTKLEDFPYYHS